MNTVIVKFKSTRPCQHPEYEIAVESNNIASGVIKARIELAKRCAINGSNYVDYAVKDTEMVMNCCPKSISELHRRFAQGKRLSVGEMNRLMRRGLI